MATSRDRSEPLRALTDRLPSFMRPPRAMDAADAARGEMFHWVIWWALLLEFALGPWVVLASADRSIAAITQGLVVVFLIGMLVVVRRRVGVAAALAVTVGWLLAVGDIVAHGGLSSLSLGGFPLLVVVAGFFWSGRAALVLGLLSLVLVIGLVAADHAGVVEQVPDLQRYSVVSAVQLLLTMVVLAAGLRIMAASRRESELRARELREIVDEMPDGVIILDRRGRVAALNPAAEQLTGFRFSHVDGKKVWEIDDLDDAQRERARDAFALALGAEPRDPAIVEYRHPSGEDIPVEIVGRTVTRGDGRRALMLVLRDLRERRRAETVQRRLEARVRQMETLESVGRLAGGVAHDFNNLLTVILTNTELLLMDETPGPNWRQDIHNVRDAARRGASLTRQLLTFARQEAQPDDASDVNAFLSESEELFQKLVGPGVRLKIRLGTGLAPVPLARTQVEQILMNLVANARDAVDGNGTVAVRTRTLTVTPRQTPPGLGLEPGDYVLIRVEDDGVGMPVEVVSRIFEPFFTTRRGAGGTGLGLATVHGIVRSAGGDIYVESELGRGTTFDVYLPRVSDAQATPPPRSKDPAAFTPRGGGRPLLLVEDEAPVAKVAARLLERDLWNVVWASGVEDARRLFATQNFAAIVCDVLMGDGKGPELIEALEAEHGPIPVVYISGFAEVDLGDAPLVHKPFRGEELTEAVRDIVGLHDEIDRRAERGEGGGDPDGDPASARVRTPA